MIHIKKFELHYGSFGGPNEELVWENDRLLYRWGDCVPHNEMVIHSDQATWELFLSSVQPVVCAWKRYYDGMVCDGLTWSVDIETDSFKASSGGNHHFPEHYDTFLRHVRRILRCKFARGHSQKNYLVTGQQPHLINRKIRYLLRRKRRRLQELADCLGYDKAWVRIRLNATTPFELEDLRKIASFLEHPYMELLYEADVLPPVKRDMVIITLSTLVGFKDPVTDYKKDLPHLLAIDPERMS